MSLYSLTLINGLQGVFVMSKKLLLNNSSKSVVFTFTVNEGRTFTGFVSGVLNVLWEYSDGATSNTLRQNRISPGGNVNLYIFDKDLSNLSVSDGNTDAYFYLDVATLPPITLKSITFDSCANVKGRLDKMPINPTETLSLNGSWDIWGAYCPQNMNQVPNITLSSTNVKTADVDATLINISNYVDIPLDRVLKFASTRSSASDSAVEKLKNFGFTIYCANQLQ